MADAAAITGALDYAAHTGRVAADPRLAPRGDDDRFGGGVHPRMREFLLVLGYVKHVEHRTTRAMSRTWRLMGLTDENNNATVALNEAPRAILGSDAPRYRGTRAHGCVAATPRARKPACGRHPGHALFRITDPTDGTWRIIGYCTRHQNQAAAEREAERARKQAGLPEPAPNTGGLLLSYFDLDREVLIRAYTDCHTGWTPPDTYSLRADDWPGAPTLDPAGRPALTLHNGGSEPAPTAPTPTLTLV